MRQRAAVLAPLHNTNRPYHPAGDGQDRSPPKRTATGAPRAVPSPPCGAAQAPSPGLATTPSGSATGSSPSSQRPQPPKAQPLYLRRTVPGVGASLRVLRLYAIHEIARCPRVQAVLS